MMLLEVSSVETTRAFPGEPLHRKRPWRARARDQRGAVAVEFALIFPILVLLVLGIIEFGGGFHAWDATQNAAREGARLGAVDASPSEITQRVRGTTSFLNQSDLTVTIQCQRNGGPFSTCSSNPAQWVEGDIVRVAVEYHYDYITPLPRFVGMGPDMRMRSVAEARFEGV
jgi:Flp pilus assembly protein TadG